MTPVDNKRCPLGDSAAVRLSVLVLSAIFAYAGIIKIIQPQSLRMAIDAYQIIGQPLSTMAAYYLPWVELFSAVALLIPSWRATGAFIMSVLMFVFSAAVISAWARGISFSCGCFGESGGIDNPLILIIRDGALLVLAVYVFLTSSKTKNC